MIAQRKVILYLIGPMTGVKNFNRPSFNYWARRLRKAGYCVINPAELPAGWTWKKYMARAKRDLSKADGIAFLDGWMDSAGAQMEAKWAAARAMAPMGVRDWLVR
jgi:hypothetical protein